MHRLKQKYNYIHVLLTVSRTQPTEFPTASPGDGLGLYSRWRLTCPDNTQDHWGMNFIGRRRSRRAPWLFFNFFCIFRRKQKYAHSRRYIFHYFSFLPNSPYISIHNQKCRLSYDETSQLQKCDTARCIFRIIIDGRPINKLHYFVTSNAQHTFLVTIKSRYHGNPNFHFCIAARCWRIWLRREYSWNTARWTLSSNQWIKIYNKYGP